MKFIFDFFFAKFAKLFPNPNRIKKIFVVVVVSHILIPIIILIWGFIISLFPEKTINAIPVKLIELAAPKKTKMTKPKRKPKPKAKPKPKSKSKPKPKPKPKAKSKSTPTPSKTVKPTQQNNLSSKRHSQNVAKIMKKRAQVYFDAVGAWLYQIWTQPNKSELLGQKPFVEVQFNIDTNGNILQKSIIKKSSVAVMNRSVEQLLASLTRLPKPPDGKKTFTVILKVVD